jgi:hypothetical protein
MRRALAFLAALSVSATLAVPASPAFAQENASPITDRSIASLSGSSQTLFNDVGLRSITERFVHNASSANSIAINLTGGTAALNTAGSLTLGPGGFWSGRVSSKITIIGTAGQPVTAGER